MLRLTKWRALLYHNFVNQGVQHARRVDYDLAEVRQ